MDVEALRAAMALDGKFFLVSNDPECPLEWQEVPEKVPLPP